MGEGVPICGLANETLGSAHGVSDGKGILPSCLDRVWSSWGVNIAIKPEGNSKYCC